MDDEATPWVQAALEEARVARLGTIRADGTVGLVPCCFSVVGGWIGGAVDHKPKRHERLQRLVDIEAAARATVLVDHYDEDWSSLWWVRADGFATVVDEITGEEPLLVELRDKYRFNYGMQTMTGPAIVIEVERWSGWDASDSS